MLFQRSSYIPGTLIYPCIYTYLLCLHENLWALGKQYKQISNSAKFFFITCPKKCVVPLIWQLKAFLCSLTYPGNNDSWRVSEKQKKNSQWFQGLMSSDVTH